MNPVLKKGESYSKVFRVTHAIVRLEGYPLDGWQIESRRRNTPKAPWEIEKRMPADQRTTDLRGVDELEYRISIGVPDCEAYVFEYLPIRTQK